MAITFVGSATGSAVNGGTVSIDLTGISSLAENDIVVAFCVATSGTAAVPSGYTSLVTGTVTNLQYALGRKIQSSTVDTSISFFDTGTISHSGTGIALAFRGVDTTTPLDVSVSASENTSNSSVPTPAITPTSDNCCIVVFGGNDILDTSVGTVTNYSTPVTITSNDDNDTTAAAIYRILTGGASSEEDPVSFSNWSNAGSEAVGITIALRPAAISTVLRRVGNIPFVAPRMGGVGLKIIG